MNPKASEISNIQLTTMLDNASETLSKVFGSQANICKLKTDLVGTDNMLVLYTPKNNKIKVVDLNGMNAYSMTMPFEINSVLFSNSDKWLIESTSKEKFILQKTSK